MTLRVGLALLLAAVASCAPHEPASAPPSATAYALDQLTLDALTAHSCERLRDRFVSSQTTPNERATGRVWLRTCTATRRDDAVHLEVGLLGWQWVDERASGFDVREYAYFQARVTGDVVAEVTAASGDVGVRLASVNVPSVEVAEVGRVSARAASLGATLLGAFGSLFGNGGNELATQALRAKVATLVGARLRAGASFRVGEVLAPTARGAPWLATSSELHVGGALLDGPFPAQRPSLLTYAVDGEAILVRPVCLAEARAAADSIVLGAAAGTSPAPSTTSPLAVQTLRGAGATELAPMPCPWVLVSGLADGPADAPPAATATRKAVLTLRLTPASASDHADASPRAAPAPLLVRATLTAFEVNATDPSGAPWDARGNAPDLRFTLHVGRATVGLGEALPDTFAARPEIASAPFVVTSDDAIDLEVVDLDPTPPSLARRAVTFEAQPVGHAPLTRADLLRATPVKLTLRNGDKTVGWATLAVDARPLP